MELFLTVAKELGIEVEVIIFPVNGKWNDYTGVSREMREKTYKKIEDVAKSHGATVLNYGNREYDDYFFIWRDARWSERMDGSWKRTLQICKPS